MTRSRGFVRWLRVAAACIAVSAVATLPVHAVDRGVRIEASAFSPSPLSVSVGSTVTWTNRDGVLHTATAPGVWSTGDIVGGASASITFRVAGTYDYICGIHPAMRGQLIVRTGGMPPTDTARGSLTDEGRSPAATVVLLAVVLAVATRIGAARFWARRSDRDRRRYGLQPLRRRRTVWR